MLERTVIIDNISYVFNFNGVELRMYIDVLKSRYEVEMTDFERRFGDIPPDREYASINKPSVVFKVAIEAKRFIGDFIRKDKPYYFTFGMNEATKAGVYLRFADRIAKTYDYTCSMVGLDFCFYKNQGSRL